MLACELPRVGCIFFLTIALACSASGSAAENRAGRFAKILPEMDFKLGRCPDDNRHPQRPQMSRLHRRTNAECFPCGDKHPGHPRKPHRKQPGDINMGDCPPLRYQQNDWERSGRADLVHGRARTSTQRSWVGGYAGGYVGGGAGGRGRCRTPEEGTWGLDYQFLGCIHVFQKWTCRDRPQGGEGGYATDLEKHGGSAALIEIRK